MQNASKHNMLQNFSIKENMSFNMNLFVQNDDNHQAFKLFSQFGLFENEATSNELFHRIVHLSYYLYDPCQLLAALFQLSGIMLPLSLYAKNSLNFQEKLNAMQQGKIIAAHCLTEIDAGTDSFTMNTSITKKENDWALNGKKSFICNANIAEIGLVYAKTTEQSPTFYDFSALLVDLKQENIHIGSPYQKLGLADIYMADIRFDNVQCHESTFVGSKNNGFTALQISTTYERILIPLAFIGRMIKLYEICHQECSQNNAAAYYLSDIFIKIKVSIALSLDELSKINFSKWSRSYLTIGCLMKVALTEAYIDTVSLAFKLFPYLPHEKKQFILKEKKSALAAWIYSGTNDSLKFMLGKLNG